MAAIPEATVQAVVEEISGRMADPQYGQVAIGEFLERHPDVGRYASAQTRALGGGEVVVHVVFHAHVLAECFARHRGAGAEPLGFAELDAASCPDPIAAIAAEQPALSDYIASNVDGEAGRRTLALIARALDQAD